MIVEMTTMNPRERYEPLVGQLDGLFNEFFRPAKAQAKFNDGVLELTLPKKATVASRKIAIQ
jgi:HSP20 family molecular chaperone IbpA